MVVHKKQLGLLTQLGPHTKYVHTRTHPRTHTTTQIPITFNKEYKKTHLLHIHAFS